MNTPAATPEASSTITLGPEQYPCQPVLVFRTSVNTKGQVAMLAPALADLLGRARWSFDLEDRDRILRIEHGASIRDGVINLLRRAGFMCAELD